MQQLLEGMPEPDGLPIMEELGGALRFRFSPDRCSFVLGSLSAVDFVLEHKGVAKEHVSFVMDINGVRIVPILKHPTYLNGEPLTEPQNLSHGAIITIADRRFVFKEQAGAAVTLAEPQPPLNKKRPKKAIAAAGMAPRDSIGIKTLDTIFMTLFVLATIGAVFIYQKS